MVVDTIAQYMDCRVVAEAAVPVYDVETPQEAVRIAISKTGASLNPDLSYVEISPSERTTPAGAEMPPAFVAADEALVALDLELNVFSVESKEHAGRIARSELGGQLDEIPLSIEEIERVDETAGDDTSNDD